MLHKRLPVDWNTSGCAVVANLLVIGLPTDELLTVIGEGVTSDDAQIAGFEFQHQLGEHTRFDVAALHPFGNGAPSRLVGQQSPPALGHPVQIQRRNLVRHAMGAPGASDWEPLTCSAGVLLKKPQCPLDAGVLTC